MNEKTLTVSGQSIAFDLTPNTALQLDSEVKSVYGSVFDYLDSTVAIDYALFVAAKRKGYEGDFEAFTQLIEQVEDDELSALIAEIKPVLVFFMQNLLRNAKRQKLITKEGAQALMEVWLKPFEQLAGTVAGS